MTATYLSHGLQPCAFRHGRGRKAGPCRAGVSAVSRSSSSEARRRTFVCCPTGQAFRAISAARLNVSQRSHLRPIDVVVYHGPLRRPHLGAGFALRCLQRLSPPDAATRLRAWRHDRHTVGPSDPVLSY